MDVSILDLGTSLVACRKRSRSPNKFGTRVVWRRECGSLQACSFPVLANAELPGHLLRPSDSLELDGMGLPQETVAPWKPDQPIWGVGHGHNRS